MTDFKDEYVLIMQKYLCGAMPTIDFVNVYLNKFKNETRKFGRGNFEILDELFGDIDAYTADASLIAENPNFYIDERQLRERVAMAINKLA